MLYTSVTGFPASMLNSAQNVTRREIEYLRGHANIRGRESRRQLTIRLHRNKSSLHQKKGRPTMFAELEEAALEDVILLSFDMIIGIGDRFRSINSF